jgi:hypothetical protein
MSRFVPGCVILFLLACLDVAHAQVASPFDPVAPDTGRPETAPLQAGVPVCRLELTRLRVSIPPWEEARPWFEASFGHSDPTPAQLEERNRCLALLNVPVVNFAPASSPTPPNRRAGS